MDGWIDEWLDRWKEGRRAGRQAGFHFQVCNPVYAFLTFSANFLFGFFCMNEAFQLLYSFLSS